MQVLAVKAYWSETILKTKMVVVAVQGTPDNTSDTSDTSASDAYYWDDYTYSFGVLDDTSSQVDVTDSDNTDHVAANQSSTPDSQNNLASVGYDSDNNTSSVGGNSSTLNSYQYGDTANSTDYDTYDATSADALTTTLASVTASSRRKRAALLVANLTQSTCGKYNWNKFNLAFKS